MSDSDSDVATLTRLTDGIQYVKSETGRVRGNDCNFGAEEIESIAPAIAEAQAAGIDVQGPFPADTIFLRGRDGVYDAIVTVYQDQGQIVITLMGFDHGVTVHAGLPAPVTTSANGSAYDIAGQGKANPEALLLATSMAANP